jgi:hypothetical protein
LDQVPVCSEEDGNRMEVNSDMVHSANFSFFLFPLILLFFLDVKVLQVTETINGEIFCPVEPTQLLPSFDLLNSAQVKINYKFAILCCAICGFRLSKNFEHHCQRYHKIKCTPEMKRSILEMLTDVENGASVLLRHQLEIGRQQEEPVEGLKLLKGFKCSICVVDSCYFSSKKSYLTHCRKKHAEQPLSFEECWIQTLNKGKLNIKPFSMLIV